MDPWSRLQIRVHGQPDRPTLVYLPGLHGDWTLVGSFRAAIRDHVRFVEFTYPRTESWSLDDHAEAIFASLREHELRTGWILAESFGSVLGWKILERAAQHGFNPQGLILAGGFVRYPIMPLVHFTQSVNRHVPLSFLRAFCNFYARYAQFRHRRAPETLSDVTEFVRRRVEPADRQAICYRYTLIAQSDARDIALRAQVPIYQLCGFFDPVVPWPFVRAWLKDQCRQARAWKLIWAADHNVLGTAPRQAADQVIEWMGNPSNSFGFPSSSL